MNASKQSAFIVDRWIDKNSMIDHIFESTENENCHLPPRVIFQVPQSAMDVDGRMRNHKSGVYDMVSLVCEVNDSAVAAKVFIESVHRGIKMLIEKDELSINSLARHMHMSRSTFYRKIKDHHGGNPMQIINECRISIAKDCLKCTNLKLSRISSKSGFVSTSHFCRVFKKKMAMTPSEYRRIVDRM